MQALIDSRQVDHVFVYRGGQVTVDNFGLWPDHLFLLRRQGWESEVINDSRQWQSTLIVTGVLVDKDVGTLDRRVQRLKQ